MVPNGRVHRDEHRTKVRMIRSGVRFADRIDFTACTLGSMRVWNRPEDIHRPPPTWCQFQLPLRKDWYGRFCWTGSLVERREHVSHKCRKRRVRVPWNNAADFTRTFSVAAFGERWFWIISRLDSRFRGAIKRNDWWRESERGGPAERYCVLNKDDDNREEALWKLASNLGTFFSWNRAALCKRWGQQLVISNYLIALVAIFSALRSYVN